MTSKEPSHSTPLDEEDKAGLIPEYVTTREELNSLEFANINQAYLIYFSGKLTKAKTPFSFKWLKVLHEEMFGAVWEWAGEIRKKDIAPGIPVHQILPEMKRFEGDLESWEGFKHEPLEIAAKIHHRLVWIHPFRNGNGRWARMASNIYLRREAKPLVKWPENEFFIESTFRKKYVQALQEADRGQLRAFIDLHRSLLENQSLP